MKNCVGLVLFFVDRGGWSGQLDFTPNELETAKLMAQEYANQGYTDVALAASTFSNRRKEGNKCDFEIIATFERQSKVADARKIA